ncbi:hypothetical protein OK016_00550 [Vibrio chagasii]|nr:hypothetical protein [Vibrio chagasii]
MQLHSLFLKRGKYSKRTTTLAAQQANVERTSLILQPCNRKPQPAFSDAIGVNYTHLDSDAPPWQQVR